MNLPRLLAAREPLPPSPAPTIYVELVMPEPETPLRPDPNLTANIYCAGHLDGLVTQALPPLQEQLSTSGYLWFLRYARRGEHLKLRIHCPEQEVNALRSQIEAATSSFFTQISEQSPSDRQDTAAASIDMEDETAGLAPDRSLLFTTYRRSPISLGGPPFTDRDRFLALFTRCLGAGCAWQLEDWATQGPTPISRRLLFFKQMLLGVAGLGLDSTLRPEMLLYCRDWLIRAPLLMTGAPQKKADQWLDRARSKVQSQQPLMSIISKLSEVFDAQCTSKDLKGPEASWWRALRTLAEDLELYRGRVDHIVDPFAVDMLFAPVIKIFSGVANQIGLRHSEQASAIHLLLEALYPEHAAQKILLRKPMQ